MKIKDFEIIVPDYKPLIKKLQSLSHMNLYFLNKYQQEKRFFPESKAGCEDYCLYIGSLEETLKGSDGNEYVQKNDLWHYPYYHSTSSSYSTAIIVGNLPGDYRSGWPSLAIKYESNKKLLYREIVCGLVDDPKIIMDVGLASLNLRADMSDIKYNPIINEAAGGKESHKDYTEEYYHEADWWVDYWWVEQFKDDSNAI